MRQLLAQPRTAGGLHELGFKHRPEPAGHPAAGQRHALPQPSLPLLFLAGLPRDQPAGNAEHGAGSIRPVPFSRPRQLLRRQVGTFRPHLLARMRHLQLDHLAAHRGIDRIDLQQPARKPGGLLVGIPRHRRLGRLQQHLAVVREALDRIVNHPVPVAVLGFLAVQPDQLQHGGDVFRVGLTAAFQVENRSVIGDAIALDLGMLSRQLREVAEDGALRQLGLCAPFASDGGGHRPPGPFRLLPVATCLRGKRLYAVLLHLRQRAETLLELLHAVWDLRQQIQAGAPDVSLRQA